MSRVGAAALVAMLLLACGEDAPATVGVIDGPHAQSLVRPDTPGNNLLFNFDPGDVVDTHASLGGNFLVHYTVTPGLNDVPDEDADASGVPDFVEEVADIYEQVLDHYAGTLGFRPPVSDENIVDNGGDGRFDVYLVDFAGIGDGNFAPEGCVDDICSGYMVQENDYAGYGYPTTTLANLILGSHEFFHAVEAAYDHDQGSVAGEGSAVWATESFNPALNDFEYFIDGYLLNPDRSLDVPLPGPVDPFSYGSGIFFRFLDERYGDGKVRALWERCENGSEGVADPYWLEVLDPMLQAEAGVSFAEAFVEFARYNLMTGAYANPAESYVDGAGYPEVKIDEVTAPYVDERMRVFYSSTQYYAADPAGRSEMTAAVFSPEDDPAETEGVALFLAVRRGTGYDAVVEVSELGAGVEVVDTNGADRLVVAVINTLTAGDSRRPALCVGDPSEVTACKDTLGSGGSGGGGSGGGGPTDPGSGAEQDEGGCGCELLGGPRSWTAPAWWLLLALVVARRRRRLA